MIDHFSSKVAGQHSSITECRLIITGINNESVLKSSLVNCKYPMNRPLKE